MIVELIKSSEKYFFTFLLNLPNINENFKTIIFQFQENCA